MTHPGELFKDVREVNMTHDEYHGSGYRSLSRSRLKEFIDDPQLYFQRWITREVPDHRTSAMDYGIAVHEMILERQGAVTSDNCLEKTLGLFRPHAVPTSEPIIDAGDETVWIVDFPGPGVVRRSDTWGEISQDRAWYYFPEDADQQVVTGYCALADMAIDGDVFHHIPEYVLSDSGAKRGKKWEAFKATCEKSMFRPFGTEGWAAILGMHRRMRTHADVNRLLFQGGDPERSFVATCVETGLEVRFRMDWIKEHDDYISVADLKSARNVSMWERDAVNQKLHVQCAMGIGALMQHFQKPVEFVFVAVNKKPSYFVDTFEMEPELVEIGADEYLRQVRHFRACLNTGVWEREDFGKRKTIYTPQWMMTKFQGG